MRIPDDMSIHRTIFALTAALLIGLPATSCGDGGKGDPYVPPVGNGDMDNDGISDADEGRLADGGPVDTDGDGTPDYLDTDSDGDGVGDIWESGDLDVTTPPEDSDGDTIPDWRDLDSDGNGVFDEDEGATDLDGDTIPNSSDPDDDGDSLTDADELQGNPTSPVDSDGDTIPDMEDLDSDNDTISDSQERATDTDGDLIPDYLDLDSDGDGLSDADEAGDTSIASPAADTDGDYIPDFRDPDSDNDGLPDGWEHDNGLDPYSADSDLDGTPDLIEVGAETDPLDATSNPRTEGNFVFIMPWNDPAHPPSPTLDPDPTMDHLVFHTEIQKADVYFTLDSSGSMMGEITNLRNTLRDTVVPGVLTEIPNVWFGIGRFEDCGYCTNDMAMLQVQTDDITAVQAALNGMTTTCGGSEPYTQNLYAVATGDVAPFSGWGGVHPVPAPTCTLPSSFGWPCFRDGSIPIIVEFGDEPWTECLSCSPVKTIPDAVTALNGVSAKFIGVDSGGSYGGHSYMVQVATGTGSIDTSGNPLVFDIPSDGSGLGTQVVEAIGILAHQVPLEVTTNMRDDPADTVDTVVQFIDRMEPSVVGGFPDPADPTSICVGGLEVADLYPPVDGAPDSFPRVLPGTIVCFDIYVKQNWTVPATGEPQTFLCEIDVIGDGITVLDTRRVYFLVPPDVDIDLPG